MTDEHTNGNGPKGPVDKVYDPLNPVWINGCSGNTDSHMVLCDGNCERRPVTALEIALFNEDNAWIRAGMDPRRIHVDTVELNIKVRALSRILERELGITEEQQDIHYQEFKLEYLKEIRTENEERVRKQQLESMIPKRAPLIDPTTGKPFRVDPLA